MGRAKAAFLALGLFRFLRLGLVIVAFGLESVVPRPRVRENGAADFNVGADKGYKFARNTVLDDLEPDAALLFLPLLLDRNRYRDFVLGTPAPATGFAADTNKATAIPDYSNLLETKDPITGEPG